MCVWDVLEQGGMCQKKRRRRVKLINQFFLRIIARDFTKNVLNRSVKYGAGQLYISEDDNSMNVSRFKVKDLILTRDEIR